MYYQVTCYINSFYYTLKMTFYDIYTSNESFQYAVCRYYIILKDNEPSSVYFTVLLQLLLSAMTIVVSSLSTSI